MPLLISTALVGFSYLVGSIPFGYLIARTSGIDIREAGSRNIGATNVSRVLGRRAGAFVLLLDVLKGLAPTLAAGHIAAGFMDPQTAAHYVVWLSCAVACVIGHICPIYLRFKGGKGVATGLGATLGVFPVLALPCAFAVGIWLLGTFGSGYVSLGSMAAALSFPLSTALTLRPLVVQDHWPVLLYTVLIPLLVIWRHRANIGRLRSGTEPRIGRSDSTD